MNGGLQRKVVAIGALAELYRRELTEAALVLYALALDDLSPGAVEQACSEAARTCKFMPAPVELRELAGVVASDDRAALAFDAISRAVESVGYYRSPDFDDPLINATVRMLGGWQRICAMPVEEFDKWYRKDFCSIYETLTRTGVDGEATLPLIGFFDQENRRNGQRRNCDTVVVSTGLPWVGEPVKRLDGIAGIAPRIEFQRP